MIVDAKSVREHSEKYLTYTDSKIFMDFLNKSVYHDKQKNVEKTTEHYQVHTDTAFLFDGELTDGSNITDNGDSSEKQDLLETKDSLTEIVKKEGRIITINGRKA